MLLSIDPNSVKSSKSTYTPLGIKLKGNWTFIGVHGGGERRFHANHPTMSLFSDLGCSELFSYCLPLHNERNPNALCDKPERDTTRTPFVSEFLETAFQTLAPAVTGKNVIFVGHSGGGMTIQKNWYRLAPLMGPESMLITLGSGSVEPYWAHVIGSFWTVEEYKSRGTYDALCRIHGGPDRTNRVIDYWHYECGTGGKMFLTPEECKQWYQSMAKDSPFRRVHMVLALQEEAFSVEQVLGSVDKDFACSNVSTCSGGHFTYFDHPNWSTTRRAIVSAIVQVCPLEAGADEVALDDFQKERAKQSKAIKDKLAPSPKL